MSVTGLLSSSSPGVGPALAWSGTSSMSSNLQVLETCRKKFKTGESDVNRQHGVQPQVSMYTYNTKVCGEENRFLLTRFRLRGLGTSCSEPIQPSFSTKHQKPGTPWRLKSKSTSRHSSLLFICVQKFLLKWVFISAALGSISL